MFPVPAPTGGQKFEMLVDSLSPNYSHKYFGKGQLTLQLDFGFGSPVPRA